MPLGRPGSTPGQWICAGPLNMSREDIVRSKDAKPPPASCSCGARAGSFARQAVDVPEGRLAGGGVAVDFSRGHEGCGAAPGGRVSARPRPGARGPGPDRHKISALRGRGNKGNNLGILMSRS